MTTNTTNVTNAINESTEVWANIPDFNDRYGVSDAGRVRVNGHHRRDGIYQPPHILRPAMMNAGYLKVGLTLPDGRKCTRLVHRLVAQAFVPGYKPRLDVNHVNGVKTDNRATNLEWVTRSENLRHARRLGLIDDWTPGKRAAAVANGERLRRTLGHPVRITTADGEVRTYPSFHTAAEALGVSSTTVFRVVHGQQRCRLFTAELVSGGVTTSPQGTVAAECNPPGEARCTVSEP